MRVKPDIPDTPRDRPPDTAGQKTCRVLMCVSQPSTHKTNTGTHAAVSNDVRATTITVVLEKILTHRGYQHGGINE
jgi:hypothetical protein